MYEYAFTQVLCSIVDMFFGSPPWLLLAAVGVKIQFHGLVDLVSDQTAKPQGGTQVLLPNLTDPEADWVPNRLKVVDEHHPRLVVETGTPVNDQGLATTQYAADGGKDAFSLTGWQLAVTNSSDGALIAERSPTPVLADGTDLSYLADMEHLITLMNGDNPPGKNVGGVTASLRTGEVPPHSPEGPRICSRVVLDKGSLRAGGLFMQNGMPKSYIFQLQPSPNGYFVRYEQYLAAALNLETEVDTDLRLEFRSLEDLLTTKELVIRPDGGQIDLRVENSEITATGGLSNDAHFSAHYLIRDGWKDVERVRFPEGWADYGGPAGFDPQCSPGDNRG